MKLTAKQTTAYRLALSGTKNVILYGGGIRSGKSIWMLATFASLCNKYPRSRWAIIRESMPSLKRTTLVSWSELLHMGLADHVIDYNRDLQTVTFRNGSQILFMSESFADDKELNRFRGLEINGAGVDELNEIQQETFFKLIERSGSWLNAGDVPILVLTTCNPSSNWVKTLFYDRWQEGTLPEQWEFIPALITDNPHIPDEYLESLQENMLPEQYKRFVLGSWDDYAVENAFASQFNAEAHESTDAVYRPEKRLFISVDFNLNPFAVTFSHFWEDSDGYHDWTFDEASIDNGSIPQMIDLIRARYQHRLHNCVLTGDAMGLQRDLSRRDNASYYVQLAAGLGISEYQVQVMPNPTHENSRSDVNYLLFQSAKPGSRFDIKFHPKNARETIRDFKLVQCDNRGTIKKAKRTDPVQRADYLDSKRYQFNLCWKKIILHHQKVRLK